MDFTRQNPLTVSDIFRIICTFLNWRDFLKLSKLSKFHLEELKNIIRLDNETIEKNMDRPLFIQICNFISWNMEFNCMKVFGSMNMHVTSINASTCTDVIDNGMICYQLNAKFMDLAVEGRFRNSIIHDFNYYPEQSLTDDDPRIDYYIHGLDDEILQYLNPRCIYMDTGKSVLTSESAKWFSKSTIKYLNLSHQTITEEMAEALPNCEVICLDEIKIDTRAIEILKNRRIRIVDDMFLVYNTSETENGVKVHIRQNYEDNSYACFYL